MTKKILSMIALVASVAACTDDYKDWTSPQVVPQPTQVSFADGSISAVDVIRLADIAEDQTTVKVCNITAPTATDEAFAPHYTIALDDQTFGMNADGTMALSELVGYVSSKFGASPTQRDIDATVSAWLANGATWVKMATSSAFKVSVVPDAPFIDPDGYYVVGNIDGWTCSRVDSYHMVNNGGDVYANPEFSVTFAAVEGIETYEIKMVPSSAFNADGSIANWDIALSALPDVDIVANEGKFSYSNDGGNIKFAADPNAKYYELKANLMEGTYSVTSISFAPFVYYIGATDGWASPDQKLASQGGGLYTGFVYIADPNGWGMEFKLQKRAGDWADDSQLNSNNLTSITGDFSRGGDNIVAGSGEGVYFVELDLVSNSLKGTLVTKMGLIGDFNGWGGDVDMTWNAADYCYEVTGAPVTENGWKFRVNSDWAINLGSNDTTEPSKILSDLVANGKNIGVAGSTIKLYPTRKTSDKIYCTVE